MSKHTPGPWFYTPAKNRLHDVYSDGVEGKWNVANVNSLRYGYEANARLIASAPDLLEALRLLYEHCRLYHPECEQNNVGETVRAAIAKATGEQP